MDRIVVPSKSSTKRIDVMDFDSAKLTSKSKGPGGKPSAVPSSGPNPGGSWGAGATQYRELLESAYEGILITRLNGEIIDVNKRAIEFLVQDKGILCGLRVTDIISGGDEALLANIRMNTQNQKFTMIQASCLRKDGIAFPCEIVVSKLHLTTVGELCFFIRDISARKAAEDRLQIMSDALHSSGNGIAVANLEGKIEYVNPVFLSMWGGEVGECVGMDARDLLTDRKVADQIVESILKNESWTGEVIGKKKDGSDFYAQLAAAGSRDGSGKLVGSVFSLLDITETKQTQQALQHAQKFESLRMLASSMGHDFNNLLSVVMGNADLALKRLPQQSPVVPFIRQIAGASRRGADLCREMLLYSGKASFAMRALDLNTTAMEVAHLLSNSISKSVKLKYQLAKEPLFVKADPAQIYQVLLNLLMNASDAIGAKNGVITVATGVMKADREYLDGANLGRELSDGDYAYIEVADTGCGIDPSMRARIFDPFYTTKPTRRGLGLAAVLGIMHGHQGALRVDSEMGAGSKFRLLFPHAAVSAAELPVKDESDSDWRGEGMVLVVDDEESVRSITAVMLQTLGFTVLTAGNGPDALNIYKPYAKKMSLVLVDMSMPHMDGEDVLREIRGINPAACVVLMSGYSEDEAISRFHGKGLRSFVQKPFNLDELRKKVKAAMSGSLEL